MAISVNVTETVVNTDVTNTDITVALTEQTTNVELTYPGPQGASAIVNVTTPITNTGTTTEPNIGIDQTLLSLTRTQIVGTAVTEAAGKALTAGTADYATLAGTSVFATNAGTSVFATTAGGAPPTGNAGGDLTGTYPNPTIAAGAIVTSDFNSAVYSATNPAALGSATAGTAATIARTDHVHPTTGLAVLASANTFTDQQTITPATSVTALVVNGGTSSATTLQVNPSAGSIGLVIKAGDANTETMRLRNTADNATLFSITDSGKITVGSGGGIGSPIAMISVNPNGDSTPGIAIKGRAAQTGDLQRWQTSAATVAQVSSAGAFTISPSSGTALTITAASGSAGLVVTGDAFIRSTSGNYAAGTNFGVKASSSSSIPVSIAAASGQTSDLWRVYASDGTTVLGGRNAVGQMWSGSTAPVTVATGGAISGTSSGTTATLTSASAHGLAVGDIVTIAGMTPSGYNGTYLVATVPTTTTFTVTTSGSNLGNSTVSGTASVPAQASITARSAGTVGLVVRAAASPVVDAQRWTDSNNTVIAKIASNGELIATNVSTLNQRARLVEGLSGGYIRMTKTTSTANPGGSGELNLFVRDGTNANTLKLVVRAGAAGAETTILDNIPT